MGCFGATLTTGAAAQGAPVPPAAGPAAPGPSLPVPAAPRTATAAPAPDQLALIRGRGELLVCIWTEYFAISWRNPRTGDLEGLDVDMAQALATRLRVALRFIETNFAEFASRLERGDCDIAMMAVGITPTRAARVAFSKPYLSSPVYAVTTRENLRIRSWADLDRPGNVIAVSAGTVMEGLMRDTLQSAELLVVHQPGTREAEVLSGRADAFMTDYPYTRRVMQTYPWARVLDPPGRFGDTLYAYAVPRNDRAWLDEVNAFLSSAKVDGTLARAAAKHGLTAIVMY